MDYQAYYPMSNAAPSYNRPEKAEDWEPYRQIIAELYRTKKLKEVMEEMETVYYFKATPRQYKGKIKQWGLDTKYTKTEEYMEILKTKKQMEKGDKDKGDSSKSKSSSSSSQAKFTVRGKPVSDSSISRFERRAKKRGILPDENNGGADQTTEYDYQNTVYDTTGYEGMDYPDAGYAATGYDTTGYQDMGYQDQGSGSGNTGGGQGWSGY